jgi:hypothetical protein
MAIKKKILLKVVQNEAGIGKCKPRLMIGPIKINLKRIGVAVGLPAKESC